MMVRSMANELREGHECVLDDECGNLHACRDGGSVGGLHCWKGSWWGTYCTRVGVGEVDRNSASHGLAI